MVLCAVSTDCGKVDDDRAVGADEDVEVREVAVHDARRRASGRTSRSKRSYIACAPSGSNARSREPRSRVALGVGDELHDEDAVDEMLRHRNAHPRRVEAMNHVDFGRPPRGLVLRATVLRPFLDGSLVARVPDLAPLGVLGAMLERAVLSLFVDLRDALLAARRRPGRLGLPCRSSAGEPLLRGCRSRRAGREQSGMRMPE